jgi:hypothetical protein
MTAPTTVKIIECLSKKDPNQTFTGPDMQGHLKDCTSQYPYNPTAELVFCYKQLVILGWHHNSISSYNMDCMRLVCS